MKLSSYIVSTALISTLSVVAALIATDLMGWDRLEALMIACVTFCVLQTLATFLHNQYLARRVEKLQKGILDYEMRMIDLFEAMSSNSANTDTVKTLQRKIDFIQSSQVQKEAQIQKRELSEQDDFDNVETTDTSNIIHLDTAKRGETHNETLEKFAANTNQPGIGSDPWDSLEFHIQPIVSMTDRNVIAYEALARMKDEAGNLVPASEFMERYEHPQEFAQLDAIMIEKAVSMARSIRRQNQKARFYINLSRHTFNEDDAFNSFLTMLEANEILNKNICFEVSQEDFERLGKDKQQRIREILDLGFKIALDNCSDISSAVSILKQNMFSSIKLSVEMLEQIEAMEQYNPDIEILEAATTAGVDLIVTHVEQDHQLLKLIDHDVFYGQGNYFSEPKTPNFIA